MVKFFLVQKKKAMKLRFCGSCFTALKKTTVIIVRALLPSVEEFLDVWRYRERLPSVEELRPTRCPRCGFLAREPGRTLLGIVGHGTYSRQVLGLAAWAASVVVFIRRYACRGCAKTISVVPDLIHPRRWYAAQVILESLRLHLIEEKSESEIREHFDVVVDSGCWRSLRRWRSQLLYRLWFWYAKRLGVKGPATTRSAGCFRLRRLLAEATSPATEPNLTSIARTLLAGTVHDRDVCWPLGHDPPESQPAKFLPR